MVVFSVAHSVTFGHTQDFALGHSSNKAMSKIAKNQTNELKFTIYSICDYFPIQHLCISIEFSGMILTAGFRSWEKISHTFSVSI